MREVVERELRKATSAIQEETNCSQPTLTGCACPASIVSRAPSSSLDRANARGTALVELLLPLSLSSVVDGAGLGASAVIGFNE